MKSLIKYILELEISELRTFNGYKGGDILSVKSSDKHTIIKIKKYCHLMEVTTNIKVLKDNTYEIFCEFGNDIFSTASMDDEIYNLKE